jgi:aspartate/methionine/tyrosine aminotransferase
VVLTASTSEAYAFLFKLLCDEGDEVLVPAPSYPLFEHLAQLEGVSVVRYPLAYDGRWHVPADELPRARSQRTRAIVCVHPNNPTGSFLTRHELAQLGGLGVPIISDEVFAPYPLCADAERVASAHCWPSGAGSTPLVFSLHGLSKLAGLPQLKLAWISISGPDASVELARARLELIADSFLSVATPIQLALPAILAASEPIRAAIRERLTHNLELLNTLLADSALTLLHVEGGWYATLRFPAVLDDEAWALDLLSNASVLVQPGYFYDFARGPFIVISLLTRGSAFREGVTRMLARVASVATSASRAAEPR